MAKSYGTASPKMQGLGTNMPDADAVESFKMVKSEWSSAGTKFVPGGLQHLLAPVASQPPLRSKLRTKQEPLGPTVGNALVVEAEE